MLEATIHWATCRCTIFPDRTLEDEFISSNVRGILHGLRISSGLMLVLGLGAFALAPHHFLPEHNAFPDGHAAPRILALGASWFAIAFSAVVQIAACVLQKQDHLSNVGEQFACGAVVVALVLPTLMNWQCTAHLFNADPSAVWGRQYTETQSQSQILLSLLGILVGCNVVLPIRLNKVWPLHALAFLLYVVSAYICHTPTLQIFPRAIFVGGVCAALLANHQVKEDYDRKNFLLIRKKGDAGCSKQFSGQELDKVESFESSCSFPAISASVSVKEEPHSQVFTQRLADEASSPNGAFKNKEHQHQHQQHHDQLLRKSGTLTHIVDDAVHELGHAVHDAVDAIRGETAWAMRQIFGGDEVKNISVAEARMKIKMSELRFTQKNPFQLTVSFLIVCNAASSGFEIDHREKHEDLFLILDHIFTTLFVMEMLMKFYFEGVRHYFREPANYLDFFCVMISILDSWIMTPLGTKNKGMRNMTSIRMFRLVRLVRLLRLFRVAKELRVIVQGLTYGAHTLFWTAVLLIIILYIFALIAVAQFGRASVCEDGSYSTGEKTSKCDLYTFTPDLGNQFTVFGNVQSAMLTLYICVTEGCGANIVKPMTWTNPVQFPFWFVFVFVASFGLLNVVIGLLCEDIFEASLEAEKELNAAQEENRTKKLGKLVELFEAMDDDHTGSITREEYLTAVNENEEVMECLADLELDQDATLFDTLDIDGSGSLTTAEFFHGMTLLMQGEEELKDKNLAPIFLTTTLLSHSQDEMASMIEQTITENLKEAQKKGLWPPKQIDQEEPLSNGPEALKQIHKEQLLTNGPEDSQQICKEESSSGRSIQENLGSAVHLAEKTQAPDHVASRSEPESWVAPAHLCIQRQEQGLEQRLNTVASCIAEGMGCSRVSDGIYEKLGNLDCAISQSMHDFKVQQAQLARKQVEMMGDIIAAVHQLEEEK